MDLVNVLFWVLISYVNCDAGKCESTMFAVYDTEQECFEAAEIIYQMDNDGLITNSLTLCAAVASPTPRVET
jgi:hypothetical protein